MKIQMDIYRNTLIVSDSIYETLVRNFFWKANDEKIQIC